MNYPHSVVATLLFLHEKNRTDYYCYLPLSGIAHFVAVVGFGCYRTTDDPIVLPIHVGPVPLLLLLLSGYDDGDDLDPHQNRHYFYDDPTHKMVTGSVRCGYYGDDGGYCYYDCCGDDDGYCRNNDHYGHFDHYDHDHTDHCDRDCIDPDDWIAADNFFEIEYPVDFANFHDHDTIDSLEFHDYRISLDYPDTIGYCHSHCIHVVLETFPENVDHDLVDRHYVGVATL